MRIADPAEQAVVTDDHPTGALGFRYLLEGSTGQPDNFVMLIAENLGRFDMVRHRHNFDQFRFALQGDLTMGDGRVLREGHLGYFPEGASYGPQADDAGPLALVIQFGGASGYGYMSPQQYRDGRDALSRTGRFEGPVYLRQRADGTVKKTFSINAVWEEAMGARMLIPAPRYDQAVFMNPRAFRWRPVAGADKAYRKLLGVFSEREVAAEMFLLEPGGSIELAAGTATRLLFVLRGAGTVAGRTVGRHCAAGLDAGERAVIVADDEMTLLGFTLPPIDDLGAAAEAESFEPVPGEAVPEAV